MKKFIALLLFSFAVIAYASPPPEPTPIMFADQVQLIVQNDYQVIPTIEVQEVAFVYLGNFEMSTISADYYFEQVDAIVLPQVMIVDLCDFKLNKLNKPPSFSGNNMVESSFNIQNSKYNYPPRADIFS